MTAQRELFTPADHGPDLVELARERQLREGDHAMSIQGDGQGAQVREWIERGGPLPVIIGTPS